ncbi:hypothetical protein M427DRAFT_32007 [Gonapodya prolifera JEL478]|uniref:FAD/NAD(P)-binding domain-containing protein n=1 Tax=Gonapodya prolifera (strain JEL478) TaxID=1344416 RepID=A0A139AHE5_GONPJ|nr:hypothetical protein M427DRAFT_32007 [Gonapodya prolifera JEL478]|eukprot:KXS15833.1 hypothetical protein M427DRAFT_32007 [Gonapodya prolifera JEL478]
MTVGAPALDVIGEKLAVSSTPNTHDHWPGPISNQVVGAAFSGNYLAHNLGNVKGFNVRAFEMDEEIGGTWNWNRYPGARVDLPSREHMFSFDKKLEQNYLAKSSELYCTQPELLRFLNYAADYLQVRDRIEFPRRGIGVPVRSGIAKVGGLDVFPGEIYHSAYTLNPKVNSWYMGANVPGKPRVVMPYIGGLNNYRAKYEQVARGGYVDGFKLSK